MSNTDKIATRGENDKVTTTVETDSDRFRKLCDIAGLTTRQMNNCKKLVVTCEHFGVIDVEIEYSVIGGLEGEG